MIMITSNRHLKGLVIGVFCSAIRHLAMSYLPAAESTSGRWDEEKREQGDGEEGGGNGVSESQQK